MVLSYGYAQSHLGHTAKSMTLFGQGAVQLPGLEPGNSNTDTAGVQQWGSTERL